MKRKILLLHEEMGHRKSIENVLKSNGIEVAKDELKKY
jgi:hypothetical protein